MNTHLRTALSQVERSMNTFPSLSSARAFLRGYCVPRVIVRLPGGRFGICSRATAKRHNLKEQS